MSWINEVPTSEPWAQANIMRCLSINPAVQQALMELNRRITFGGSCLSRVQEELIATTVSTINRCRY
jgi:alkylhydroperoxidase family enzyme